MTDTERAARIAEIQARRAARGDSDPLNLLRAYTRAAIERGESPVEERRASS